MKFDCIVLHVNRPTWYCIDCSGGLPIRRSICSCLRPGMVRRAVSCWKMLDEKLNRLSIMSVESGLQRKLFFSDIISEFVKRKAKMFFS